MAATVDECIRAYTRIHLRSEGRSSATIEWHRHVLGRFALWLRSEGRPLEPSAWTPLLLKEYHVSLAEATSKLGTPYSPHSLRSMHSSLRAFCRWLFAEKLTSTDLMTGVARPKTPSEHKPNLSPAEIHRVLAAARQAERHALRDEAVVLFLLDTGARATEAANLGEHDLDWDTQTVLLHGKGAKDRRVPFGADTARAMQRYALRERRGSGAYFFQGIHGEGLTRWGIAQLCQRLGARCDVELNPHKFRHTFAITFLRAGGSVFALQKMLGHASLDMSLRYSHMLTEDLVREHEEHGPVAFVLRMRRDRSWRGRRDRRQPGDNPD